ncbi:MAG: ABC transporter permease, partial [Gemmatimonadota bacterium]
MRRSERGEENRDPDGPPRLAESVLKLFSPSRYRDQQLGDLREAFAARQARTGRSAARRWYRLQVMKSVIPNLAIHLRRQGYSRGSGRENRPIMHGALAQDLAFLIRSFRRRPAFYSTLVLVFGLGIGANTVVFSAVDGVVLRPLPYPASDRLVAPWETDLSLATGPNPWLRQFAYRKPLSYPVYQDWLEQNTVFENLGVYRQEPFIATQDGQAERISGTLVTHGVLAGVGVPPILGRTFVADDDQVGAPRVVLLSHRFWQREFGSDSSIIGQTLVLDEAPFTIVGVMPRGFQFPEGSEMWVNFRRTTSPIFLDRDANNFLPVARLRPGVTLNQAQRRMEILAERLKEIHPIPGKDYGVNIVYLQDDVVGNARSALLLLLGTVAIFLVIACANIATLLLVRASERRNELAVRLALGAGRGRILRQLATEGLALSGVGGLLGCLAAIVCVDPFIAMLPSDTPRLAEVGVDGRVLAFSALLTVLTGVTVATLPALGTFRARLSTVLKDTSRRSAGSRKENRTQALLLVSEIALTFVLLVGAGLLTRSFARLTSVERGFDAEGVVTVDLDMRGSRYASETRQRSAFEELYERLRAIPGVISLGATRMGAFSTTSSNEIVVETPRGRVETSPLMDFVSGSYFRTMGIPLLAGRTFSADERWGDAPVVIVNDALARAFWPNESAIGKEILWGEAFVVSGDSTLTIVGVVGNVRRRLDAAPHLTVYYPLFYGNPTIVLKTGIDP